MDSKQTLNFYHLQGNNSKKEIILKAIVNDDYHSVSLGDIIFDEPIKTSIFMGEKLFDFLHFNDAINFAISKRFYKLLIDNKITGWKTYEINIEKIKDKYYGFQITGRSGKLDMPKVEGFHIGYKFDYDSWDGSDIFCPEGTGSRFITQKVKDLIIKNKITNISLKNINDVKYYSFGD